MEGSAVRILESGEIFRNQVCVSGSSDIHDTEMMEQSRQDLSASRTPRPTDFEEFFVSEHERLFRALVIVTRDLHEAEEVMQEAFVRLWERWDRVSSLEDPVGYLYRTAMRLCLAAHRRASRSLKRAIGAVSEERDALAVVEARHMVHQALLRLPVRQRAAVVLTKLLGFDSLAAGRILGIRPGTVRRLVSQARATITTEGDEEWVILKGFSKT
jgi:RNA polymerase sigma-70 factor (ECF subfamily)